jgi:hypothetical protein
LILANPISSYPPNKLPDDLSPAIDPLLSIKNALLFVLVLLEFFTLKLLELLIIVVCFLPYCDPPIILYSNIVPYKSLFLLL